MSFTGLRQPISQVIRVKFDIPANTPAGAQILGQFITDPALPSQPFLDIPANEVWHVVDVYAEASGDIGVDGYVDFIVNDLRQNLRFGPVSQTLRTLFNPVRLRQAVVLDRLSKVTMLYQTRAPSGTSATSVTLTVEVVRIPLVR